jgi:hypothetical protein
MKFDSASDVEQVCWTMKLADYSRALNRSRINNLFNGFPPYSEEEVKSNDIAINVNSLEGTRIAHDARAQFYGAFMKPGNYFQCRTDDGPKHKRQDYGTIFTQEINKIMKKSMIYFETFRSKFALDVLHGIGPATWDNPDDWCPDASGIEDIFIPSMTLITMKNLPFLAFYRSYTAAQLIRFTRGPRVDKAWNMPLVNSCIEWIDKEAAKLMGSNWQEIWTPEKAGERIKGDGACYSIDKVPTINVFDFYYWSDDGNDLGWRRRMIIDAWSSPELRSDVTPTSLDPRPGMEFTRNQFLFNPGTRKYADKLSELVNWQYADLSAVAPFRYHSIRSLGFLLYAVCHLQNRLRCRFNEAVFENMLMYFRCSSSDEVQRALKLNLFNRGIIDESLKFVPAAERHQINTQLVELGLMQNSTLMRENSSAMTQNTNYSSDRVEKTKFQVMAEVQNMNQLVSAGLLQAYKYQQPEYYEIVRRFCRHNSRNADVLQFQANCKRRNLPEKMICAEAWEVTSDQVMGNGNKTLEMAIAEQLMQYRSLYEPDAQRKILRDVTLAITDDPARASELVPDQPNRVTDSVHDAELSASAMLNGTLMGLRQGVNHQEYAATLLRILQGKVQTIQAQGGTAPPQTLAGMQILAGQSIQGQPIQGNGALQHMQVLAQDDKSKQIVKQLGDVLGKLMNEIKAFAQRWQEMQQQQAAQNGNKVDPQTQAKVQAQVIVAKAKAQNARESHAEKTAQRRISFEQEQAQKAQRHAAELRDMQQDHNQFLRDNSQEHVQDLTHTEQEHAQDMRHTQREHALDIATGQIQALQAAQSQPGEEKEPDTTE